MTLAEFLAARRAEDEAAARACADYDEAALQGCAGAPGVHLTAARALREIAAKRAILAEHRQGDDGSIWCRVCDPAADMNDDERLYPCITLRHLAAVWSDHPDYDPAWRP